MARKKIASLLNCKPNELIFTSGGTEADNMAIACAIRDLGCRHIITTKIEHKAVLDTSVCWEERGKVKVSFLKLTDEGRVDMTHLSELLASSSDKTLVSVMHGNNEIGVLADLDAIGNLCKSHGAYFHSDTVQTMAHYRFDLSALPVDFATCSAHKFHGPKGIGFLYVSSGLNLKPMITGGGQERNLRAGTENLSGIVGLAAALESAYSQLDEHHQHISGLKQYMKSRLEAEVPGVAFNGDASEEGLYTVLNVSLPPSDVKEMFLFSLDIMGICASGGSACSSGSDKGSHVMNALGVDPDRINVRFSFGRFNDREEIDSAVTAVKEILSLN